MSRAARNDGATRRELVAGAVAGAGIFGALAAPAGASHEVSSEDLLNAAATAEAVAAIVGTVGQESGRASGAGLDVRARAVVEAAARADLTHHDVLSAPRLGGRAEAQRMWVPDQLFAGREPLLRGLLALKDVLVNVYLVGATTFGNDGNGRFARFCTEIAGVEAVHRALCLDALGLFAADRVFLKYSQPEENPGVPAFNRAGFRRIESASRYLRDAGFGLGEPGTGPGSFITLDEVRGRTPNPAALNTYSPR